MHEKKTDLEGEATWQRTGRSGNRKKAQKELPALNSDVYQLVERLTPDERAIVKKVRPYVWTTPRIIAIAVGLEINAYACTHLA
jgi:coenzyme PQQ precursor peptide PqqA